MQQHDSMATPDSSAGRILVVDDEPPVGAAIKAILSLDGHEVVVATNGHEALALLKREKFDLSILDYMLPGMKGDQLAALIKAQAPDQPVVMISGLVEEVQRSGATLAGVDLILGKPFTSDEIRRVVVRLLKSARLAAQTGTKE